MIDIGSLECMSLDLQLPESNATATVVGRFTKNKPNQKEIPEKYKAFVILHSHQSKHRPKILCTSDELKQNIYGYFLTRSPIEDSVLSIMNWSFYVG